MNEVLPIQISSFNLEEYWNFLSAISVIVGAFGIGSLVFQFILGNPKGSLSSIYFQLYLFNEKTRNNFFSIIIGNPDSAIKYKKITITSILLGYFWFSILAIYSPFPYVLNQAMELFTLVVFNLVVCIGLTGVLAKYVCDASIKKYIVIAIIIGFLFGVFLAIIFIIVTSAFSGNSDVAMYSWLCCAAGLLVILLLPSLIGFAFNRYKKERIKSQLSEKRFDLFHNDFLAEVFLPIDKPASYGKTYKKKYIHTFLLFVCLLTALGITTSFAYNSPGVITFSMDGSYERVVDRTYNVAGQIKHEVYKNRDSGAVQSVYDQDVSRFRGVISFKKYDKDNNLTGVGSIDYLDAGRMVAECERISAENNRSIEIFQLAPDGSGEVVSSVVQRENQDSGKYWVKRSYKDGLIRSAVTINSIGDQTSDEVFYEYDSNGNQILE